VAEGVPLGVKMGEILGIFEGPNVGSWLQERGNTITITITSEFIMIYQKKIVSAKKSL
jgi:hypothetical protein